ncbi:hypothetical protein V2G26_020854 [Clonostachys chloroleuca]
MLRIATRANAAADRKGCGANRRHAQVSEHIFPSTIPAARPAPCSPACSWLPSLMLARLLDTTAVVIHPAAHPALD